MTIFRLFSIDFTSRRLAILGLLVLITVLLLASWKNPTPSPQPDRKVIEPGQDDIETAKVLVALAPSDQDSKLERLAVSDVLLKIAGDVSESLATDAAGGKGEFRTVEQVIAATRVANTNIVAESRKKLWTQFFKRFSDILTEKYEQKKMNQLPDAVRLWKAVGTALRRG